jgi:DNA-binding NtrC family response regulator
VIAEEKRGDSSRYCYFRCVNYEKNGKLHILYFDDEVACLDIFQQMFGDEHHVQIASTLADVRRALSEASFDIIISDQQMPEIDGLTFLREVAETHPESYRVMMTGSIGIGNAIREIGTGIIHLFITKPWAEPNMRGMLERESMSKMDRNTNPRASHSRNAIPQAG